jgi:hypothetical protein
VTWWTRVERIKKFSSKRKNNADIFHLSRRMFIKT